MSESTSVIIFPSYFILSLSGRTVPKISLFLKEALKESLLFNFVSSSLFVSFSTISFPTILSHEKYFVKLILHLIVLHKPKNIICLNLDMIILIGDLFKQ